MKGQKFCPDCNKGCGPRTLKCACGYEFLKSKVIPKISYVRKRTLILEKENNQSKYYTKWYELKKGDKIQVSPHDGPYMLLKDGTSYSMGHKGIFTVRNLDLNGIHAYGRHGYAFIWMGSNEYNEKTNIYRRKHKIRLLTKTKCKQN